MSCRDRDGEVVQLFLPLCGYLGGRGRGGCVTAVDKYIPPGGFVRSNIYSQLRRDFDWPMLTGFVMSAGPLERASTVHLLLPRIAFGAYRQNLTL